MTSNDHNDYIITHKLFQPIISHENNMKLTEIPTDEENYSTINSFKDQRAPRADGMGAAFFTSSWDVIHKEAVDFIQSFFSPGVSEFAWYQSYTHSPHS